MEPSIPVHARFSLPVRDPARSRGVAETLRAHGFAIVAVSPRGVDFTGSTDQFEREFAARPVHTKDGLTFDKSPELPGDLADTGACVYLPTPPEFLA